MCLPVRRRRVTAVSVERCAFYGFGAIRAWISRDRIDRYGGHRGQVSIYMHLSVRKYAVSIRRRRKNRATARVRRRFPLARMRSRFRSIGRSCVVFSLFGIITIAVVMVIGLFSHRPCPFAFKLSRRYSWSRCEKGWRPRGEGVTCGSRGRRIERCSSLFLFLTTISSPR